MALNSALLLAGLAAAAVAEQRGASLGGQSRYAWLLIVPLLPLQAVALHGAEFNELLRGTPHEVVSFTGAPSPGSTASPPNRLNLAVSTHGHDLVIALEKHDTLFAEKYEHIVLHANGSVAAREPLGDHCIYRGRLFHAHDIARAKEVGDALLSVCSGDVEGSLRIGDSHTLAVAPHPAGGGFHAVFRHHHWGEATKSAEWTCGVDDGEHSHATHGFVTGPTPREHEHGAAPRSHAVGPAARDHERDAALHRHAVGHAPHERRRLVNGNVNKYVELVVVNDYARCQAFLNDGKTLSDMATRSAGIVAVVDGLYKGGYTAAPYFTCVFALCTAPPLCLRASYCAPRVYVYLQDMLCVPRHCIDSRTLRACVQLQYRDVAHRTGLVRARRSVHAGRVCWQPRRGRCRLLA